MFIPVAAALSMWSMRRAPVWRECMASHGIQAKIGLDGHRRVALVLLVEDDHVAQRDALARDLVADGHHHVVERLLAVAVGPPQLRIRDHHLPADGVQALGQLHRCDAFCSPSWMSNTVSPAAGAWTSAVTVMLTLLAS